MTDYARLLTEMERASKDTIDGIDALLVRMSGLLDQEKADHGRHTWADIGSLVEIKTRLQETVAFWTEEEA